MTRSQLLARLWKGLRRDSKSLDSACGDTWRRLLSDLAELRLLKYQITDRGEVFIYIDKQIAGRTR